MALTHRDSIRYVFYEALERAEKARAMMHDAKKAYESGNEREKEVVDYERGYAVACEGMMFQLVDMVCRTYDAELIEELEGALKQYMQNHKQKHGETI